MTRFVLLTMAAWLLGGLLVVLVISRVGWAATRDRRRETRDRRRAARRAARDRRIEQQNLADLGTVPRSVKHDILIGTYDDRDRPRDY